MSRRNPNSEVEVPLVNTVTIIYQGGSGQTTIQANAVAKGAASVAETEVVLLNVDEARQSWDLLNSSDAIIFGSPTQMGIPPLNSKRL